MYVQLQTNLEATPQNGPTGGLQGTNASTERGAAYPQQQGNAEDRTAF